MTVVESAAGFGVRVGVNVVLYAVYVCVSVVVSIRLKHINSSF